MYRASSRIWITFALQLVNEIISSHQVNSACLRPLETSELTREIVNTSPLFVRERDDLAGRQLHGGMEIEASEYSAGDAISEMLDSYLSYLRVF